MKTWEKQENFTVNHKVFSPFDLMIRKLRERKERLESHQATYRQGVVRK